MLLGSFQALPRDNNGNNCSFNKVDRQYYNSLGFRPIWCFPITEDFEMSYFQCLTVAPNIPEVFMIFETDDFVKIDRLKHYKIVEEQIDVYDISSCINNEIEDLYSEYIINADNAEKYLKNVVSFGDLEKFLNGNDNLNSVCSCFKHIPKESYSLIRNKLNQIPLIEYEEEFVKEISFIPYENFILLQKLRFVFICFLFPIIYRSYLYGESYLYWIFSCYNHNKFLYFNNDFTTWNYNDLSKNGYEKLFDKFKSLIITNEDLLKDVAGNILPYPNDICPYCNSGKKFKKCCGKNLR